MEFALVVPLFALLLFAVAQFGITFSHHLALTDSVRAGARVGAVSRLDDDPAGATAAATRRSAVNLDDEKLQVAVASQWRRGSDVTVTATYPYRLQLLGLGIRSGRITATATNRVE